MAVPKAVLVAPWRWVSPARRAERRLPTNDGFAGFSNFDVSEPYASELEERA